MTLDGQKALTYVRSRHHIDDQTNIARMRRQQQFLTTLHAVAVEQRPGSSCRGKGTKLYTADWRL